MMTVPCQKIPRNKKRSNPSPSSSQSLTSNMKKKTKTTNDTTMMLVFNLPPYTNLSEFSRFLSQKIWEMHGKRVNVVNCEQWMHSSHVCRVEFSDSSQRNDALSMNGVEFHNKTLSAAIYRQRGGGRVKRKQYLCSFFPEGRCKHSTEYCCYAHGVLDLKLHNDTQLHMDRCVYVNQIDTGHKSSFLFHMIRFKYQKQHGGSMPIITALHHRQPMGDALIEFGNPIIKSKASDVLNGLGLATHPWASGYQDIFLDYFDKNIHIEIKLKDTHPVDVPTAAAQHPTRILSLAASSQDVSKEIDPPPVQVSNNGKRQVRAGHLDRSLDDCQATTTSGDNCCLESSTSSTVESSTVVVSEEATRPVQVIPKKSSREVCRSAIRNWLIADNNNNKAKEERTDGNEFQHDKGTTLDSSSSFEYSSESSSPLRPLDNNNNNNNQDKEDQQPEAMELQQDTIIIAPHQQEETSLTAAVSQEDQESEEQQQQPTMENNDNNCSPQEEEEEGIITETTTVVEEEEEEELLEEEQEFDPWTSENENDSCPQEEGIASETVEEEEPREKEPGTESHQDDEDNRLMMEEASNQEDDLVLLQNVVVVAQQQEMAVSQDQQDEDELEANHHPLEKENCPQEGIAAIVKQEPRDQEEEKSQEEEDETNHDMSEHSDEVMPGSEQCKDHEPLRATCHSVLAANNDPAHMDRMRQEIIKLKSEQVEKDQMIEELKHANVKMEMELDVCKKDARRQLEKLVGEKVLKRKLSVVKEEVDRLRRENNDLRPKLKCKEEQTKQLKVEVYDLLKIRCDVLAEIKKVSGGGDRIKSDQDDESSVSFGADQVSEEDHKQQAISLNTILEVKKHLEEASAYLKEKEAENERLRDENLLLQEELEQRKMCQAMELGFMTGEAPPPDMDDD